jgi:hypothetical protein
MVFLPSFFSPLYCTKVSGKRNYPPARSPSPPASTFPPATKSQRVLFCPYCPLALSEGTRQGLLQGALALVSYLPVGRLLTHDTSVSSRTGKRSTHDPEARCPVISVDEQRNSTFDDRPPLAPTATCALQCISALWPCAGSWSDLFVAQIWDFPADVSATIQFAES